MWLRIFALVKKELLATFKDKKSRNILLLLPILQILVFPHATTFEVTHVRMAVLNEDSGRTSRDLLARFRASSSFLLSTTLHHDRQIEPALESGEVLGVLHVGPDFSARLKRKESAPLQVLLDGRNSNTALIALSYVQRIVEDYDHEIAPESGRVRIEDRALFNPNLSSLFSLLPAFLALITLVAVLSVTAFSVAREKESGTFQQLLVTPLRPMEIVAGKTIPALLFGLFEGAIIVFLSVRLYGMPLVGGVLPLLLGHFLFLLSITGAGLMLSSLSRTQQQALLGGFFFNVPVVILSGFATPIENMPHWVQLLTLVDPMRYFLHLARAVALKGSPLPLLVHDLWPMALIAAVTLTAAAWLFRKRLY